MLKNNKPYPASLIFSHFLFRWLLGWWVKERGKHNISELLIACLVFLIRYLLQFHSFPPTKQPMLFLLSVLKIQDLNQITSLSCSAPSTESPLILMRKPKDLPPQPASLSLYSDTRVSRWLLGLASKPLHLLFPHPGIPYPPNIHTHTLSLHSSFCSNIASADSDHF